MSSRPPPPGFRGGMGQRSARPAAGGGSSAATSSKATSNKAQLMSDYRDRAKKAMKNATDNIIALMLVLKIPADEAAHKFAQPGRLAEHNTLRFEVSSRAELIVKAMQEILILNNEIKEYLILRDFKAVDDAVRRHDQKFKADIEQAKKSVTEMRQLTSGISKELSKEVQEQFYLTQ